MKIKNILIVLSFLAFLSPVIVFAQDSNSQSTSDLSNKIEELQKKITDKQNTEKTLANELQYINDQVNLAELKIQNSIIKINKTENDISKISGDIDNLKTRIDRLVVSIDYQQKLLQARMRESYKSREESIVLLFGSDSVEKMIQKLEYLQVMEKNDNKLLEDMRQTKEAFTTQKRLFEEKKTEQINLKKQLENEKANLDAQRGDLEDRKVEKQKLMDMTQNDEAKYQKMLNDAVAELNQIVGAAVVLRGTKAVSVKKGDVIGIQGHTGYSFGDHLHFGVYKYSSFDDIDGWNWYYSNYVDPQKMLSSKTLYWDTGCEGARNKTVGGGSWAWPMSKPQITQGFGYTCWSNRYYGGKPHPALDMAGPIGSPVFAVADGKAYSCRNCLGDGGNGVFIFHSGGYMTLYWHLR